MSAVGSSKFNFDPSILDSITLPVSAAKKVEKVETIDKVKLPIESVQPVQPIAVSQQIAALDPRLLNLSYSGRLTLHSCPRRFQLEKLNAEISNPEDGMASVTYSFGQVVGLGLQLCLEGKSYEDMLFQMYLLWKPELFQENEKQKKSFWYAVQAVERFISMREDGFLNDYELVWYNGKPANELSFRIHLPNGFKYRGFIDAVLRNKKDGRILVLECKTTASTSLNSAMYKNSSQAIGYSVVLDRLFDDLSSYEVLYLVYTSKDCNWTPLPFTKTFLQRALWLQELLLDVDMISMYERLGVYPMHGESCFDFYHECKYFNTCTLSTAFLSRQLTEEEQKEYDEKEAEYQIEVTFEELVQAQLGR